MRKLKHKKKLLTLNYFKNEIDHFLCCMLPNLKAKDRLMSSSSLGLVTILVSDSVTD